MSTTWGNKKVPQILLPNFVYSRKYYLLRLTPYQFATSQQAWVFKNFSLSNAMVDEKGKRILLQTAILIQTQFISGIIRVIQSVIPKLDQLWWWFQHMNDIKFEAKNDTVHFHDHAIGENAGKDCFKNIKNWELCLLWQFSFHKNRIVQLRNIALALPFRISSSSSCLPLLLNATQRHLNFCTSACFSTVPFIRNKRWLGFVAGA